MKKAIPFIQRFGAELFGTTILSLFVLSSLIFQAGITPIIAGVILAIMVYSVGHISGAHINPAVTVGAFLINKITWKEALVNIAAQFAGAGLALAIAFGLLNADAGLLAQAGVTLSVVFETFNANATNTIAVGLAEMIGMALFTFGIASVVYGRVEKAASGLVVGASLIAGLVLATALGSSGVLNPAVALSMGHFNAMYILGPIVGSIVGMWLFTLLDMKVK